MGVKVVMDAKVVMALKEKYLYSVSKFINFLESLKRESNQISKVSKCKACVDGFWKIKRKVQLEMHLSFEVVSINITVDIRQ